MGEELLELLIEKEWSLGNKIERKIAEEHYYQLGFIRKQTIKIIMPEKGHDPLLHGEQIINYYRLIGEKLNLPKNDITLGGYAALLHDVGKLQISSDILNKPGKLNEEEWIEIRKHPLYSEQIILPFSYPAKLARHHHEGYDGKGYSDGLSGENIPLGSRIICVIDAFNAMTHQRSYNKVKSNEEAIKSLIKHAGTQFDPKVVKCFISVFNVLEN